LVQLCCSRLGDVVSAPANLVDDREAPCIGHVVGVVDPQHRLAFGWEEEQALKSDDVVGQVLDLVGCGPVAE